MVFPGWSLNGEKNMSVCMAEGFDVQRQLRTFYRAVYVYRRTAEHYRPLAGERQIAWNKVRDKPLSETSLFILGKIAWNESIAKNATVRDLVNALYLDQGELHDLTSDIDWDYIPSREMARRILEILRKRNEKRTWHLLRALCARRHAHLRNFFAHR